jgi:CubicO group peptidase (beta-lactamase class C family)
MGQPDDERFAALRATIPARLLEHRLPSLAIAVARGGSIIWEDAFGWADRERRLEATPHTMYSLASISKPITATALMVLVERGAIDLDRPIDDYLGAAKLTAHVGDAREATVRRVANHTAGLPLHYQFFYADEPARRPPMDETIRRYGHLVTAPGERFQYANLGFGLLDYIISRAAHTPYADFMRREVFLPLGMTRASVDIEPGLAPFTAARYGTDGVPYPFYDFDHPGGSAVFCSAHDLVRFGIFHLKAHLADQHPILPDAAIDAMQQRTTPEGGSGYGVGWFIEDNEYGYRVISHGGGMGGVATLLTLVPSEQVVVVTLANASSPLPFEVAAEILDALLPHYAERRAQQKAAQPEQPEQPAPFAPPPELLGSWRGSVLRDVDELPFRLTFQPDGDVHARLGDQLATLVNDTAFADNRLSGELWGDLGTPDARRRPHHLRLDLTLRDDALNGAVIAISDEPDGEGGAPGRRVGNALAAWAELRREAD